MNKSLINGIFPTFLKTALVTPVLKKNTLDSDDMSNYRPISNLAFLAKLIEKCVYKQLVSYLDEHKLFSDIQSGYRAFHSCETALVKIHNDLLAHAKNSNHHSLLVLLDLSAAFDTVNHDMLFHVLHTTYGLKGKVIDWIMSYLSHRTFKVTVNRTKSGQYYIKIGVPQGSILGPLLFILFTKDLEHIAKKYHFKFHCYADDSQIYFCFEAEDDSINHYRDMLEKCLVEVKNWMTWNFLKLNPNKTEAIEIVPFRNQSPVFRSINFDGYFVPVQDSVKTLGVYFDNKLSFNKQVNEIVSSCNFRLKNLSRIGSKLTPDLKKTLVKSFILSRLDYCNGLYNGINQVILNKLQTILNASARFALGIFNTHRRFYSSHELLSELHFLPMKYRVQFKIALLSYKCVAGIAPPYLKDLVSFQDNSTSRYNLCLNNEILRPKLRPRYKKK